MCRKLVALLVVFVFLRLALKAQESSRHTQALTNADVIRQMQLGDSDSDIIANIERHHGAFTFDNASIAALTRAGISANIKRAMFESSLREGAPVPPPAARAATTPATATATPPTGTAMRPPTGTAMQPPTGTAMPPPTGAATPPPPPGAATPPVVTAATAPPAVQLAATAETAAAKRTAVTTGPAVVAPVISAPHAARPVVPATRAPSSRTMTLNWQAVSTHEVVETGNYTFVVAGINDIIYQYELTVTLNPAPAVDNIKALADLIKPGAPTPAAALAATCTTLRNLYDDANGKQSAILAAVAALQPTKQSDGKFPSIPLNQTLNQWDQIKTSIPAYVAAVIALKAELGNSNCANTDAPDLITKASQLVLDYNGTVMPRLQSLDAAANSNHALTGDGFLDRTRGGSVVVRELFGGTDTSVSPRTFPLEATFSVVTASGGFLLTEIQSRSYSSVNQATGPTSTATVLGISGTSAVTPALVGLLNFHDPFSWPLNKPNFGFAISAGPVIQVTNGQADTSQFGFFGGVSVHLWRQVFLTPGVHVGQFADFPQGFTMAGQTIPPNFGTLAPVKRYTARFAFAVTFRGSNPTSLLGTGSQKSQSQAPASPPASSGPKQ
jgi:hypothetical protein